MLSTLERISKGGIGISSGQSAQSLIVAVSLAAPVKEMNASKAHAS
jgi:hypothetical protein